MSIIIRFDDDSRGIIESSFSIQNIVFEGLNYGKFPGDWYGISNVTNILQVLNEKYLPLK